MPHSLEDRFDILAAEFNRQAGQLTAQKRLIEAQNDMIDRLVRRVDALELSSGDPAIAEKAKQTLADVPPVDVVAAVSVRRNTPKNNVVAIPGAKRALADYLDNGLLVCR